MVCVADPDSSKPRRKRFKELAHFTHGKAQSKWSRSIYIFNRLKVGRVIADWNFQMLLARMSLLASSLISLLTENYFSYKHLNRVMCIETVIDKGSLHHHNSRNRRMTCIQQGFNEQIREKRLYNRFHKYHRYKIFWYVVAVYPIILMNLESFCIHS